MAFLTGPSAWTDVYQLEETDPVVGGPPNPDTGAGMDNIPHLQLWMRTEWLKAELAKLTPAQILALVKEVHGPGSGLNADLLDNRQAADFVLLSELLIRIRAIDGAGSGVDADTVDGRDAAAFIEKSGGTMTGLLALAGAPTSSVHAATKLYVDQQRDTRLSQTQGDGRYFQKSGGEVSGPVVASGTVFSHGDECLVWSETPFAVDSIVLARYTGNVEKKYGVEVSGDLLQVAAASGNDNNDAIGRGTWVCLGYASGAANASSADRTTFWFRKF